MINGKLVPSATALSGMDAAEFADTLAKEFLDIIDEVKAAQIAQGQLTVALGNAVEQTLIKSSQGYSAQALGTALAGGFGVATTGATMGMRLYRNYKSPDTGVNTASSARDALIKGDARIDSGAAAQPGKTSDELSYLRNIDFKNKSQVTPEVESDLSTLKSLKGAKDANSRDVDSPAGKLYDNILEKIDADKKEAQTSQESYQNLTELLDRKLSEGGMALSNGLNAVGQFQQAGAVAQQAEAARNEQFAKFSSDSMGSNIQQQQAAAKDMSDTQKEVMRNTIELGRINSPV